MAAPSLAVSGTRPQAASIVEDRIDAPARRWRDYRRGRDAVERLGSPRLEGSGVPVSVIAATPTRENGPAPPAGYPRRWAAMPVMATCILS